MSYFLHVAYLWALQNEMKISTNKTVATGEVHHPKLKTTSIRVIDMNKSFAAVNTTTIASKMTVVAVS